MNHLNYLLMIIITLLQIIAFKTLYFIKYQYVKGFVSVYLPNPLLVFRITKGFVETL